eukprot:m.25630 g.25630  ORF g.25630 m.25630 type:complete len:413 (+) comp7724_c0_seq1:144-1382(+)
MFLLSWTTLVGVLLFACMLPSLGQSTQNWEGIPQEYYDVFSITPTQQMRDFMQHWRTLPDGELILHNKFYEVIRSLPTYETARCSKDSSGTTICFGLKENALGVALPKHASYNVQQVEIESTGCMWSWDRKHSTIVHNIRAKDCHTKRKGEDEKTEENVVYLGGQMSARVYHFPNDVLTSLAYLPKDNLEDYRNYTFLIVQKSGYCLEWLELLGIDWKTWHIVNDESVKAKNLIIPARQHEWGANVYGLEWLSKKLRDERFGNIDETPKRKKLIFTYRPLNGTRGLFNRDELLEEIKKDANIEVVDARAHGGSLRQQIDMYSDATIIVGTHGAALMFSTYAPRDACVIEFHPILKKIRYFFWHMSLSQKRIHVVVPFNGEGWPHGDGSVAPADLRWALDKCLERQAKRVETK